MSIPFTMTSSQSIEELIAMIASDIEFKKNLVSYLRKEYTNHSNCNNTETITINKFTLFDLIDELDITISQSLQAIQTLQTEIYNLKETISQANEEIQKQREYYQSIQTREVNEKQLSFDYSKIKGYNAMIEKTNALIKQRTQKQASTQYHQQRKEEEEELKSDKGMQYDLNDINTVYTENIQIPIKQSIRQIIKCPSKREYSNSHHNKQFPIKLISHNMNDIFDHIKKLIEKICKVDTNRLYLADKYGNGNYEEFIKLVNNQEIDYPSLEEELKIIAELMTKQVLTTSDLTNTTINYNNNNMTTSRQSSQTQIVTHTLKRRNIKGISRHIKAQHSYIEPVKFSSYLRTHDNKATKNKPMSFSQDKKYK